MSEESTSAKASADEKKDEAKVETKEEKAVEVPAKFKSIVDVIEKMSVLDLSELVKILEDKFGVSAAPVAVAGVPQGGSAGAAAGAGGGEEKSTFDVELAAVGDNKIGVIKAVREISGKGLKDAKDMVESAPIVLKEGVKKEEAEEMKKKVEEAGGSVTLK